jgi:membrane protease subunit (stomatin/prohibitin family)
MEAFMFDFFKKQLVDVIEWLEQPGQLAWRVPFVDQEIQNGAQLTVREGQIAAFLNEGKLADVFGPGLHTLDTANLPVLTSLMNWDKGFKSPFKSDIVFYSLKEQPGLKWGTPQPITVRDAEFGAMRIRAFGTYSFKLAQVEPFTTRLLGTMLGLTAADIEPQLRSAIQTAIAAALGSSGIPFLDLAANQQKMSEQIKLEVEQAFAEWGLNCLTFFVESVSLPEEVQAALDRGSSARVVGDLDRYTKFQAAESLQTAAAQSGGMAGIGAGMAAGAALGGAMSQGLAPQAAAPAAAAEDPFAVIEKLHRLVTIGALSQEEFDLKKAELLARVK